MQNKIFEMYCDTCRFAARSLTHQDCVERANEHMNMYTYKHIVYEVVI